MNDRDFLEACAEALNICPRRTLLGTGPGGFDDTYQLAHALTAHLAKKSPYRPKGEKTPSAAVSAVLADLERLKDRRAGKEAPDQVRLQSGDDEVRGETADGQDSAAGP